MAVPKRRLSRVRQRRRQKANMKVKLGGLVRCPACGLKTKAHYRYCVHCGADIKQELQNKSKNQTIQNESGQNTENQKTKAE